MQKPPGNVVWHSHCPATWPQWARDWAKTRGSLTKRLQGLEYCLDKGTENAGRFFVQPVQQGLKQLPATDALFLKKRAGSKVRQRLVRLGIAGKQGSTLVLARTLVGMNGARNDWGFWKTLGSRSLGTMLFFDPKVKRGPLFYARLAANEKWVQQLLRSVTGEQALIEMPQQANASFWYARMARFKRPPGTTPMWVFEVFMPALEKYDQGRD